MVAVVTGASDGIGKKTAILLRNRGYKVYCLSRSEAGPYATSVLLDISDKQAVEAALAEIYRRENTVDVLVCCAGVSLASPADMTAEEDARYLFDVNFWGCVHTAAFVLQKMKQSRAGRIVFVSSLTGTVPLPHLSFYSASKAALTAFGLAMAGEARRFGVRVTVLAPGGVKTGFTQKRKKYSAMEDTLLAPALRKAILAISTIEQEGIGPEKVAARINRLLAKAHPAPFAVPGLSGHAILAVARLVPTRALCAALRAIFA